MANIDFVPTDYIQQQESSRTNFMYLVLFAAVMAGIGLTFSIIKMRQRSVAGELATLNAKLSSATEQITRLDELKAKNKSMMKTMVVTSELIEPVPKSLILACVTNNLPDSVSLLEFKLNEKEIAPPAAPAGSVSQYKAASAAAASSAAAEAQKEKIIETDIELEGIAPSDIEVAAYLSQLSDSVLLDNVELVESKETSIDKMQYRQFKLRAQVRRQLTLTKEDVEKIRQRRQQMEM